MNNFDYIVLHALSRLHGTSFDHFMIMVAGNLLLKGGVVMAAMWWLWFNVPADEQAARAIRRRIIAGFCATVLAMGIARGAHLAMYRPRPLNYPNLFTLPQGTNQTDRLYMQGDSSFPSDHATLFYSLAVIIFMISRRMGIVALIYVSVFICLPRMYLLLHYPTDILVGGALGAVCVIAGLEASESIDRIKSLADSVTRWSQRFPGTFYALMFVWSFSIAELFDSVRSIGQIGPVLRKLLGQH